MNMASFSPSDIAKFLNLNSDDSNAFFEVVNAYFGPRNEEDKDFSDDEGSDQDNIITVHGKNKRNIGKQKMKKKFYKSILVSQLMYTCRSILLRCHNGQSMCTSRGFVNKKITCNKSPTADHEIQKTQPASNTASVYVHWPYCIRRCTYCNFNKYIDTNVDHSRMTDCLVKETQTLLEIAGVKHVSSVFFGGGTPSLAQPSTISTILKTINSVVGDPYLREVTLEVNPTGFETDILQDFKASGVNRVSLGVQTLDPHGLMVLGREHTPSDSLRCLETARSLFNGLVSVDLIFAWPGQSLQNWLKELDSILSLCDNHVSLYQLTLERGTQLFKLVEKGFVNTVDEDEKDDMYLKGIEVLSGHGFERYEVSNFAKQDNYCFHNLSYWSGHQYIGIGPGAHGRFQPVGKPLREARIQTLEPKNWMYEVEKFGHATRLMRSLTPLEQLEELLIAGLRTKWGVSHQAWTSIVQDFALDEVLLSSGNVMSHMDKGLLIIDNKEIRATEKGINVIDAILPDLLYILQQAWNR